MTREQIAAVLEFAARSLDAPLLCTPPPGWLMRILSNHGTPAPLIPFLEGHSVTKAKDLGWERLVNGELLKAAEQSGF